MTNAKLTRRALLSSVLSLVLCFTMLLGTTFAWFTDEAVSSGNKIIAGNLDVQLLLGDGTGVVENYADISNSPNPIFGVTDDEDSRTANKNNADTLWEPGKTQVAYLAIANAGNLDLKYQVVLEAKNEVNNLCDVMQYAITPDAKTLADVGAWTSAQANSVSVGTQIVSVNAEGGTDLVLKKGETHYFALSIHMDEKAGNEYKNGEVEFDITVRATQLNSELDSIDPDYDKDAPLVAIVKKTVENTATTSATVNVGGVNKTATVIAENNTVEIHNGSNADDTIADADDATVAVTLPAGVVLDDGATELQLVTKETDAHEKVTLTAGNVTVAYDIKVEGVVEATADPIVVTLKEALPKNLTNVKVYHNGDDMGANEFSYDINTGDVTLYVKHFSNFTFSGKAADMTVVPEGAVLVSNAQDLTNALTTAKAGDIVFLMDDITLTKGITIADQAVLSDITLDGNSKTITLDMNGSGYGLHFDKWPTGVEIKNLTIEGSAQCAILLYGGSSSKLTNVTVTGDYDDNYGSVWFYGTHGATLDNCQIVDGFSNGQAANKLNLTNGTTIGTLRINDGATMEPKLFIDSTSSITTLYADDHTAMIDPNSIARIGTILEADTEKPMVAEVNGVLYSTLALAVANAGETVVVNQNIDMAGATVAVADGVKLMGDGDVTISNAHFTVADDQSASFTDIKFAGATTIEAKGDGVLNFTDCEFNVTPQKYNGFSRAAAIIGANQYYTIDLNLEGCIFNYQYTTGDADLWNAAIFMWSNVNDCKIKNCTFNGYGFMAVKLMNVAEGAEIVLDGNTFNMCEASAANYFNNDAVQIAPQHDNTFSVVCTNNTFNGAYDQNTVVDIEGMSGLTLTKYTLTQSGNTINGVAATDANFELQ